jgi:hypothetical protein
VNTGLSFVLAIVGWLCLSGAAAITVGRVIRESERDLRSIRDFERARRPFRHP